MGSTAITFVGLVMTNSSAGAIFIWDAGPPSQPIGVTATTGNRSAQVSWTAPNANGATITGLSA